MNRLKLGQLEGITPAVLAAVERQERQVARFGMEIGSRMGAAEDFIALDISQSRVPPSEWDFVSLVQEKMSGGQPTFAEDVASQLQSFWRWYMPVEGAVLRLCELVRFFAEIRDNDPAFEDLLQKLCAVVLEMHQRYGAWAQTGRIEWLPKRLGFGPKGRKQICTIVELLNEHALRYGGAPPAWASEPAEPPMELPF